MTDERRSKLDSIGFVWDASHLTGKATINPDPDKLGHKNVWHYLYTIDKKEYAEKFGKGYRPFERSYGKRKYFVRTEIPVDDNALASLSISSSDNTTRS